MKESTRVALVSLFAIACVLVPVWLLGSDWVRMVGACEGFSVSTVPFVIGMIAFGIGMFLFVGMAGALVDYAKEEEAKK